MKVVAFSQIQTSNFCPTTLPVYKNCSSVFTHRLLLSFDFSWLTKIPYTIENIFHCPTESCFEIGWGNCLQTFMGSVDEDRFKFVCMRSS